MGANYFGTGIRFTWGGMVYEVTRVFPQEGKVNVENISLGASMLLELTQLQEAFFEGQLEFLSAPPANGAKGVAQRRPVMDLSDFSEQPAAIARYRYEVIRPLLALKPHERTRQAVEKRIQEVRAAPPPLGQETWLKTLSRRSIFRWIGRLARNNGDLRSLVPNFRQCGGPGRSRLPGQTDTIIRQTIEQLYKTREKVTVKDLLYEVALRVEEENRLRPASDQLTVPSRKAINHRIDLLDLREWLEAKTGKRAARRALHQSGQKARPHLPYEVVEMDTTRADYLVLDDDDDLPLGRLNLTYGLDRATGYPVGFHVSFEPPSYLSTMECLYHLIRKKDNVRERYGTAHDWNPYGVPALIVVDNGPEFANQHLEDACLCLGSEVLYAPVKTPEFKAGIERYFGSLNTGLLHTLPGTTFTNPQERGDYDSADHACLYLSEVIRALHLFTVDIYAQEAHKDGRGHWYIPARRWEAATQNGFRPPLPNSVHDLLLLLGRVATRTIQPYGIEFENLRYNCAGLGPLRLRLAGEPVKIKYHPGDLSRLYLFNPFAQEDEEVYLEVPACDPEGYTQHLSLWKHRVILRYARAQQDKPDLAALGQAKREIRAMIQAAKGRKGQRGRKQMARFETTSPSLLEHAVASPRSAQAARPPNSLRPILPSASTGVPSAPISLTERLAEGNDVSSGDWELTFSPQRNIGEAS